MRLHEAVRAGDGLSPHEWAIRIWTGDSRGNAAVRAALTPAELAFRATSGAHHWLYDRGIRRARRAAIPVVSVGNLRVGGSGKTPFAAWLLDRLLERGQRTALAHGGYALDEPALHRRWHPDVPVLVGRDRHASAAAAAGADCDVLVLDDAFQHRRLARDLDIVLVAAEHLRRPVRLFPVGPWREPLSALHRADLVVVTRKAASREEAAAAAERLAHYADAPVARVWLRPGPLSRWTTGEEQASAAPDEVLAVAAIAEPRLFFENLRQTGAQPVRTLSFPDHHEYGPADLSRIAQAADGLPVATTAKDAIKLERLLVRRSDPDAWSNTAAPLWVLEQQVVLESGAAHIDELLVDMGT